jgi:hypothetical protein
MPKEKPVVKKTTKKSNNPANSYPANKDNRGVPTIGGGEGTRPPFTAEERRKMPRVGSMGSGKNGKTIKKAKSGAKFDLNKDGKTTFKDVLIGRGVLPKKAKSGNKMKKAQTGAMVEPIMKSGGKMKKCKYGCK